jgi:hypothetical protein
MAGDSPPGYKSLFPEEVELRKQVKVVISLQPLRNLFVPATAFFRDH